MRHYRIQRADRIRDMRIARFTKPNDLDRILRKLDPDA